MNKNRFAFILIFITIILLLGGCNKPPEIYRCSNICTFCNKCISYECVDEVLNEINRISSMYVTHLKNNYDRWPSR